MKNLTISFTALLLLVVLSTTTTATAPPTFNKSTNFQIIEDNLITGVKSDNLGLKVSSAYYLGEYKSENAVIPLLRVLKSDKNESARVMAALSLYKIGDSRGIFAIKRAATFDDSDHVRKICGKFYNEYKKNNK